MVIIRNLYYAKSGLADAVHTHRHHACDVREKLGLPRGRVQRRLRGADNLPDVIWECEFADVAAYERDMAALAASQEFGEVRATMRAMLDRFERVLWETTDG